MFVYVLCFVIIYLFFFFQAEDGIRDLVRSRGLGDVYKRQIYSDYRNSKVLIEKRNAEGSLINEFGTSGVLVIDLSLIHI